MAPLKKTWVSHPIMDDDEILRLAKDAGCWYVYQAIVNTSDGIRKRIRRLKDNVLEWRGRSFWARMIRLRMISSVLLIF
jgi:hypothetical protein